MAEYNQSSFLGGMNLLLDDTRLQPNQYRVGFNLRNRYDVLDPVLASELDSAAPAGVKQEVVTFGNFLILFVRGEAWYRYYTSTGWTKISQFGMSPTAPRYWTCAVPVATTLYARVANGAFEITSPTTLTSVANSRLGVQSIASAFQGNLPGLLVQDNINQPQFIFIGPGGIPVVRITQQFTQWSITINATTLVVTDDSREYVPIGNAMAFVNGILYIAGQDSISIYRSVSGRPLDFVVNVNTDGSRGGDATTTSYSVGVGGITCLRAMSNNTLFVAASNANFSVAQNTQPGAVTEFGEPTFIRTFLFNATCVDDRCIIDTLGDTRFIANSGIRSFNAVQQTQNEGRNEPFSATIQRAFRLSPNATLIQTPGSAAAILYDDYELYAVNTVFGAVIAVYDTLSACWSGCDQQVPVGQSQSSR